MPTWRNDLPTEQKHMGFDIRRTPQAGAVHGIITADDILVCDTHFFHGRTSPCERPQTDHPSTDCVGSCPACAQAIPYRSHVYISCFDANRHEHFIFECTTHAAKPLAEYRAANKTLRGCILHATRPKGAKNSRVVIETNTANLAKLTIPAPPDLTLALSIIWRLAKNAISEAREKAAQMDTADGFATRHPTLRIDANRLREMRDQPDNQPEPPTMAEVIAGNGQKLNLLSTP
jgi:hypothetical protein